MNIVKRFHNNIHTAYMNLSFKHKIMLFFYTIIILVVFILGTYAYAISSHITQSNVAAVNLRDIKQTARSLEFLQKDIYDLSTFVCLNPAVQAFIQASDPHAGASLEPLNTLLASKDYISFMALYNKNGEVYYISSDRSTGPESYVSLRSNSIYERVSALKGAPMWLNLNAENQIFIQDNRAPKIAMLRTLLDNNSFEVSGLMVICINHAVLKNILYDSNPTPGTIALMDEGNGVIVSRSSEEDQAFSEYLEHLLPHIGQVSGSKLIRLSGKKLLLIHDTVSQSKWKIVSVAPVEMLLKSLQFIMAMTLGVLLACLIIAFIFSVYTSSILSSPIKRLLSSMEKAKKGDFKEKVDFKYNDEIGMLGAQYNDTIDNINTLIKKVYKLQIKEREAELKALQAQINPHFLYNTLDAIFWKAEKNKQADISEMVYALSRLFRITLSRGNEFIKAGEEKEFIEHYLLLQGYRFKSRLTYNLDFDPALLDCSIPKLIIQPFVENAIIHGMEALGCICHIKVTGLLAGDKIVITIEDNGSGMSQDRANALLSPRSGEGQNAAADQGYAISNVNQRLALYYDNDYKLNITSTIGIGTKVEIVIPMELKRNFVSEE